MANLHLVTGYGGSDHVTAADDGSLNAAIFGGGQYVLNRGNNLSVSVITSNLIRVLDGDILMQGRHVRLNEGTYVDLTIDNGAQGMKRNDLIVCRYTKNTSSGIEECNLVVIKGTATSGTATDPAYTEGDILTDGAVRNDFPLYRIHLDGLTVDEPESLFEVISFQNELEVLAKAVNTAQTAANNANKAAEKAQTSANDANVVAQEAKIIADGKVTQFFTSYTGDGTQNRVISFLETGKSPSIAVVMKKGKHDYATDVMVIFGNPDWRSFYGGFQFTGLGSMNNEINIAQGRHYNGGIRVDGGDEYYGFNVSGESYYVWGLICE